MKKYYIKIIGLCLCLSVFAAVISGCDNGNKALKTDTARYSEYTGENTAEENSTVQNKRFMLLWNNEFKQVVITDRENGAVYSTMPTDAMKTEYDSEGFKIKNNPVIESPIIVYYNDLTTLSETDIYASDAIENDGVYAETLENGIKVTYDFYDKKISVPVYYRIFEDRFEIAVEPKEIKDDGENRVTAVALAPFLCSLKNDGDGYFLLPDGCGSIVKPKTVSLIGEQGFARVYGDDLTVSSYSLSSYKKSMNMPIFGFTDGEKGLFSIISSSEEQAYLCWNIGSENTKYSSVYPMFRIRGYDYTSKPKNFLSTLPQVPIFSDSINTEPLKISYYPLYGEKANYNGMAEFYREYLVKAGKLTEKEFSDIALDIRVLGGLEKKAFTAGLPHTELSVLTSVNEIGEIVKYLSDKTGLKFNVTLEGFGKSGLDIGSVGGGFKIAGKFGSKKDIASLKSLCDKNGVGLYISYDIIRFKKNGCGFSSLKDAALLPDQQIFYNRTFNNVTRNRNSEKYLLLARNRITDAIEKATETAANYGFDGINIGTLSNVSYSDYRNEETGICAGMGSQVSETIQKANNKVHIAASNPNIYAAYSSNYITDAPLFSSGYDMTSEEIPFYQMVMRGYVQMSCESFNLANDSDKAFLKCVETGMIPSYTFSYRYNSSVITSEFSALSVSKFEGLKDETVNTAKKTEKLLKNLGNAKIKSYEIVNDELRITRFDNGMTVAVNYSDSSVLFESAEIKPKSFYVWGE